MSEKPVTPDEHEKLKLLEEIPITKEADVNYCTFFPHNKIVDSLEEMLSKDNTVKNKTILLTGRWGTGKTSILNLLKESQSDKTYIEYDAWITTPDMILREFLHDFFDKTSTSKLIIDKINTVEKKEKTILPLTLLAGATVLYFGNSEFLDEPIKQYTYYIILVVILMFIITLLLEKTNFKWINKLLSKLSYKSKHSTEYAESTDITPRKMKDLLNEYKKDENKNSEIVIIIDNLDRLSEDQQKNYIDALYTFDNALKYAHIKVTTIIAIDKAVFLKPEPINISYFDKISPYEISLPELDERTVNLYFRTILSNPVFFATSLENNDIYLDLDLLIETYEYFKNASYPKLITEKHPLLEDYERLSTPRFVKKVYNQTVILYNNWIDTPINGWECFKTCFLVACSRVFNQEQQLSSLIAFLLNDKDYLTKHINGIPWGWGKQINEDMKITVKLFTKHNALLTQTILSGKTIPTKAELLNLCANPLFAGYLEDYINTFGLNSTELQDNIRDTLLSYEYPKNARLGLDYITSLRLICKKNGNNFDIFTDTFSSSLLTRVFDNDNHNNTKYFSNDTISTLMLLYIRSSNKEKYQDTLYNLLKTFVKKQLYTSNKSEYDNRGYALFIILKYFNNQVEYFNDYKKLHNLVKQHLVCLIKDNYCIPNKDGFSSGGGPSYTHFITLSADLRSQIWKLIPIDSIRDCINGIENKDNNEDSCKLLLDLYIAHPDIHKSEELQNLFKNCYKNDSINYFIKVLLLMEKEEKSKIFIDTNNTLLTIQPDSDENYIFYLINTKTPKFTEKLYKDLLEKIADVLIMKQRYDFSGAWLTTPIYKYLYKNYRYELGLILQDIRTNYRDTCYPSISGDSNEAYELAAFIRGIIHQE